MVTTTLPGRHRSWRIEPRKGTGPDDNYTVLGAPIPGDGNPAAIYENGQFPSWFVALDAMRLAEAVDDGSHQEERVPHPDAMDPGSTFVAMNTTSYVWCHWVVTYDGVLSIEGISGEPVRDSIRDYHPAPELPR